MRLRLGFAVLWALMLHAMVVLGWLSAPAEQERNPNIADANDPMPMVEVALTAPPSPTLDGGRYGPGSCRGTAVSRLRRRQC